MNIKIRSNPFSGIKTHANELSKLLDSMFPKDKKRQRKSHKNGSQTNEKFSDRSEKGKKRKSANVRKEAWKKSKA